MATNVIDTDIMQQQLVCHYLCMCIYYTLLSTLWSNVLTTPRKVTSITEHVPKKRKSCTCNLPITSETQPVEVEPTGMFVNGAFYFILEQNQRNLYHKCALMMDDILGCWDTKMIFKLIQNIEKSMVDESYASEVPQMTEIVWGVATYQGVLKRADQNDITQQDLSRHSLSIILSMTKKSYDLIVSRDLTELTFITGTNGDHDATALGLVFDILLILMSHSDSFTKVISSHIMTNVLSVCCTAWMMPVPVESIN